MNKSPGFLAPVLVGLLAAATPAMTLAEESAPTCNGRISAGYRSFSADGVPARAAEYRLLDAGPVFGLQVRNDCQSNYNLSVAAEVQDERDYQAGIDLSYRSLFRLEVSAEGLVHNLEHIPYQPGIPESRPPGIFNHVDQNGQPGASPRVDYQDHDPGRTYDLEIDIYQAHLRGKLPLWPAHLNLDYWRLERQGKQQLRFGDENCAGACHLQSTTRDIDRVTEEVRLGMDAHLGWIDIAFEQLYRQFREKADPPVNEFDPYMLRENSTDPASYAHDPAPDSRLTESTFKASTSPAGGLIAAGSFTLGERKNEADFLGAGPIEAETDYYRATGDLTYTPGEHWTVNFRYRLLDLDASNSDFLTSNSLDDQRQPIAVREAPDLRRAFYAAALTWRPVRSFTLKGEFKREDIHRGNTGGPVLFHNDVLNPSPVHIDPVWELPEQEVIDRFRLGFRARFLPKSALRINGWAEYRTSDDPAYGASFEEAREAFLGLTWSPAPTWGTNFNLRALADENDNHRQFQFSGNIPVPFDLDRQREQQDLSGGFWVSPADGLTFTANYGYMRTRIIQDLLYGAEPPEFTIVAENTEYSQRVHTVSAGVTWQIVEQLKMHLEGYHIRSEATYSPDFAPELLTYLSGSDTLLGLADADSLRQISRLDLRQNGLRSRLDWQWSDQWGAGLAFTYDDFDDRTGNAFDGTVQTYLVSLSRTW